MTAAIQTRTRHEYLRVDRPHEPVVRPNYAVRRAVAVALALVAVLVFAAIAVAATAMVGAAVDVGGRPAAAADIDMRATSTIQAYVAQPGDTLWSIADQHRGEVGRDRFVDALIDLNGGTSIQAGELVRLP